MEERDGLDAQSTGRRSRRYLDLSERLQPGFQTGDRNTVAQSVEHLRRAYPHLTVSYHADNFAATDPLWLEALESAGMPLT
jgi:hypothetical protein